MADYRYLFVRKQLWAAYPAGMRFPKSFSHCYPMRGGGKISRILFMLNRVHMDCLFARRRMGLGLKRLPTLSAGEQVAFFWPAASRSVGRFYGYRVDKGRITEYWKLATITDEQSALIREAENTKVAKRIAGVVFRVPSCLGTEMRDGVLIVRYEALPSNVGNVPLDGQWRDRITCARRVIAEAGYQHGDFGWHNFKRSGGDLWVLDWEEMSRDLPRLTDEISFETMASYYNEGCSLDSVCRTLYERYNGMREEVKLAIESMADRKIAMGDLLKERWK